MTPTGSNKESMRDSVLEREEGERERVSRVRHTTRRNYQSTVFCFHKKGPKIFRPTFTQEVLPSGYLPPPLSLISSHSLFVCLSFLMFYLYLLLSFHMLYHYLVPSFLSLWMSCIYFLRCFLISITITFFIWLTVSYFTQHIYFCFLRPYILTAHACSSDNFLCVY